MISREFLQEIVNRYFRGKVIEDRFDEEGKPIPLPANQVTEGWALDAEESMIGILEDCCAMGEQNIRRALSLNGGVDVEDLDPADVALPAIPGTIRVLRGDMVRKPT